MYTYQNYMYCANSMSPFSLYTIFNKWPCVVRIYFRRWSRFCYLVKCKPLLIIPFVFLGFSWINFASQWVLNLCHTSPSIHLRAGCYFTQINGHYFDFIMGTMVSQITNLTIIYSTVDSGADRRKHQSSASLAFVWGIHRGPVSIWWRHHGAGMQVLPDVNTLLRV